MKTAKKTRCVDSAVKVCYSYGIQCEDRLAEDQHVVELPTVHHQGSSNFFTPHDHMIYKEIVEKLENKVHKLSYIHQISHKHILS